MTGECESDIGCAPPESKRANARSSAEVTRAKSVEIDPIRAKLFSEGGDSFMLAEMRCDPARCKGAVVASMEPTSCEVAHGGKDDQGLKISGPEPVLRAAREAGTHEDASKVEAAL